MVQAKDLKQPKNSLKLKGKKYDLVFNMNTLALLEEYYGSVDEALKNILKGSIESSKVLLWSSINSGIDEFIPIDDIGKLVSMKEFPEVNNKVLKAFAEFLPDVKEEKTKKKVMTKKVSLTGLGCIIVLLSFFILVKKSFGLVLYEN